MGVSPFTSELDTLLVGTYVFSGGAGRMQLSTKQDMASYDVIILSLIHIYRLIKKRSKR